MSNVSLHPEEPPSAGTGEGMLLNSPLSPQHLDRLIGATVAHDPDLILDHGCGWGEVLLRAAETAPRALGIGIELHAPDLERGRSAARARGLQERVTFIRGPATENRRQADVLISLGAYQAFGDVGTALEVLREDLRPGGRALFGLEYWSRAPTPEQLSHMWPGAALGDCLFLPDLVERIQARDWRILDLHDSSRSEFDAFELGHLRPREEWLARRRKGRGDLRRELDQSWSSWLRGHRETMGFVTFVLA